MLVYTPEETESQLGSLPPPLGPQTRKPVIHTHTSGNVTAVPRGSGRTDSDVDSVALSSFTCLCRFSGGNGRQHPTLDDKSTDGSRMETRFHRRLRCNPSSCSSSPSLPLPKKPAFLLLPCSLGLLPTSSLLCFTCSCTYSLILLLPAVLPARFPSMLVSVYVPFLCFLCVSC